MMSKTSAFVGSSEFEGGTVKVSNSKGWSFVDKVGFLHNEDGVEMWTNWHVPNKCRSSTKVILKGTLMKVVAI